MEQQIVYEVSSCRECIFLSIITPQNNTHTSKSHEYTCKHPHDPGNLVIFDLDLDMVNAGCRMRMYDAVITLKQTH